MPAKVIGVPKALISFLEAEGFIEVECRDITGYGIQPHGILSLFSALFDDHFHRLPSYTLPLKTGINTKKMDHGNIIIIKILLPGNIVIAFSLRRHRQYRKHRPIGFAIIQETAFDIATDHIIGGMQTINPFSVNIHICHLIDHMTIK